MRAYAKNKPFVEGGSEWKKVTEEVSALRCERT